MAPIQSLTATNATAIAQLWLATFGKDVSSGNIDTTVSHFLPHGWLRDVLVFTWNNRSLSGIDNIKAYLSNTLPKADISNVVLDERQGLEPETFPVGPSAAGVSFVFKFSTPIAHGRGMARLLPDSLSGTWKALSVFMMMDDLKGHEEVGYEEGVYGGHTLAWEDVARERRVKVEANPHVIVVGAGQTGLHIAARFRQMNIPTIVVEQNPRVGDVWRKCYPTLSLHTPRSQNAFLYQSFPKNWPFFTPRDKVANWLEQYADSQDLIVWTNSTIVPKPLFDPVSKTWTVHIRRDGNEVELHPAHIVITAGTLGAPRVPAIAHDDIFEGEAFHSSKYQGGKKYAGKRVVVVGAGNTSADICQDLSFCGASSVTMVQRSSTCVVSSKIVMPTFLQAFPEDVPHEISDFKFASMPMGLLKKFRQAQEGAAWESHKEFHDGLRKAGLKLNMGKDGSGHVILVFDRGGGYWIDVGVGELITSGKVLVKQGVEPKEFTANSIIFNDATELEVDVVVWVTGYTSIRDDMKEIFGREVIDRTSEVWGLDDEGEIKGCYRPSGQPGLWFTGGNFYNSRWSSKQLALEIKAIELGLMPYY